MMMSVENTHDRNELHNICVTFIGDDRERDDGGRRIKCTHVYVYVSKITRNVV